MDFKNAKELLELSQNEKLTISEVMRQRELSETENSPEELYTKMERVLEIMKDSSSTPIHHPVASMGGLIGGEAKRLSLHEAAGMQLCGKVLHKAMTRAMAVLETNASMGLIVAAPTAGSAGIVPGLLLALQDVYGYSDEAMIQVLSGHAQCHRCRSCGRLSGRGWDRFRYGLLCRCRASWRNSRAMLKRCLHRSDEHAWAGL